MPNQPNETVQPLTRNPEALVALLEATREEAVEKASVECYQDPAVQSAALDLAQAVLARVRQAVEQ